MEVEKTLIIFTEFDAIASRSAQEAGDNIIKKKKITPSAPVILAQSITRRPTGVDIWEKLLQRTHTEFCFKGKKNVEYAI